MKKLICLILILAVLSLSACSQYAEPDVSQLMDQILSNQDIEQITAASESDIEIIFDIDLSICEDYSVSYSGKGGYADIVAIFKLNSNNDVESAEKILSDYKSSRYEDFKGYAPLEADKIENGKVLTYGRYVLLLVVPDISSALNTVDTAFKS